MVKVYPMYSYKSEKEWLVRLAYFTILFKAQN